MRNFYATKLIVSLCIFLFSSVSKSSACGPMLYSSDTRFSLLSPYIIENDALVPFSYNIEKYPLKNDEALFIDRNKNLDEWVKYGEKKYQSADVLHLQYNTEADSFLNIAHNEKWEIFEDNDWIKFMTNQRKKYALDYFIFSKEIEKTMLSKDWGQWSDDKSNADKNWPIHINKGLQQLKKVKKDNFIQERYAFQIIKCIYYNKFYNNDKSQVSIAKDLYEKYLKNSSSIVSNWALIYMSDLVSDANQRMIYLLEAFDKTDEKKKRAVSLINFDELKAFNASTSDKYLKEISTVILNLNNRGRGWQEIQEVYKLNPNSPYLKLMINREVNKLEEWIWSYENNLFWPSSYEQLFFGKKENNMGNYDDEDFWSKYYNKNYEYEKWALKNRVDDIKYLIDFRNNLIAMSKDGMIKPAYMTIVIAHLYNMSKEFKEAEKLLKSMHPAQTDPIVLQYHYEKNIVMLEINDFTSQRVRDLFTISLVDMHEKGQHKLKNRYYNDYDNSDTNKYDTENRDFAIDPQFLIYTGNKLIEKGLRAEGALFISKASSFKNEYTYQGYDDPFSYGHISVLEKYLFPEDVDKIIELTNKKHLNLFEKYMIPLHAADKNMYLDLKGTLLLRQKEYAKALKVFESIPEDFWSTSYEFASYLPIHSVTELPKYLFPNIRTGNGHVYSVPSKKEIVKEIVHLQNTIDTAAHPKTLVTAQTYLANALFNISYYGTSWMTFAYGKSSRTDHKSPYSDYKWTYYDVPNNSVSDIKNYYGLEDAIKIYTSVMTHPASDNEQKALATSMIIKSLQYIEYYDKAPEVNFKISAIPFNSTLLKNLNKYSNTSVYKTLKTHCPDF